MEKLVTIQADSGAKTSGVPRCELMRFVQVDLILATKEPNDRGVIDPVLVLGEGEASPLLGNGQSPLLIRF